jgi:hypothetical protein
MTWYRIEMEIDGIHSVDGAAELIRKRITEARNVNTMVAACEKEDL